VKIAVASKQAARLLHEGSLCMSDMERQGIRVDVKYLREETKKAEQEIIDLKAKLYADPLWDEWQKAFGKKAALNSRDQLGQLCFEMAGYPRGRSL
jgi:DNA polymerase I-like protein with 3'-5' exonuclease and polymerase domains